MIESITQIGAAILIFAVIMFLLQKREDKKPKLKSWGKGYDKLVTTNIVTNMKCYVIDYDTKGYIVIDREPTSRNLQITVTGINPFAINMQLTGRYTIVKNNFICELSDEQSFIPIEFVGAESYFV